MRPSDPHQQRSTRPNLFAKAQRAPANCILARLDQDAPLAQASTGKTWMVGGGLTVMLLIGVLAWVVHLNTLKPRLLPPEPVAKLPGLPVEAPRLVHHLPAVILEEPVKHLAIATPPAIRDVHAAPPHAARPKKPSPPARVESAEAAPVDTDIAILSAIVAHRATIAAGTLKASAKSADNN